MKLTRNAGLVLVLLSLVLVMLDRVTAEPGDAAKKTEAGATSQVRVVTVEETMSGVGYTYARVAYEGRSFWTAGPKTALSVGDTVTLPPGAMMTNFRSNAFDRTFDRIEFVSFFGTGEAGPVTGPMPSDSTHTGLRGGEDAARIEVGEIARAEGGLTVAELNARAGELSGREITVRGRVVKFSANIMGKNWLHIRDGSGDAESGSRDMAVTTDARTSVGDVVLVTGMVATDKDFGAGYKYRVIIENARVAKE